MKLKTTFVALAIALLPGFAFAQAPATSTTPVAPAAAPKSPSDKAGARVDARQAEQQKRIDAGVKSGELNQKEAARLQKGQASVQKKEDKARADGKITPQEARRVEHAQDQQSKKIDHEKHDKQKAK